MLARDVQDMRALGRMGGLSTAVRNDVRANTLPARSTFLRNFEEKVRAEHPELPESEIQRRALALRKLHFARMALRSAETRARKNGRRKTKDATEAAAAASLQEGNGGTSTDRASRRA